MTADLEERCAKDFEIHMKGRHYGVEERGDAYEHFKDGWRVAYNRGYEEGAMDMQRS